MSHFSCVVFANSPDDFDRLLAPYDECNSDYFSTFKVSDEKKESLLNMWKQYGEEESFEDYVTEEGYILIDGDIFGSCNENAIYDYYDLDGRYVDFCDCLIDEESDGIRMKDYSFVPKVNEDTVESLKTEWDMFVRFSQMSEEELKEHRDEYRSLYNPAYIVKRYGSFEQYVKESTALCPYCFITPDGVLHAPGTVGWFACDDATAESFNKYYDEWMQYVTSDVNPFVSFVDCHI